MTKDEGWGTREGSHPEIKFEAGTCAKPCCLVIHCRSTPGKMVYSRKDVIEQLEGCVLEDQVETVTYAECVLWGREAADC